MGLDMYLSKKTYVKNWDYMEPGERIEITVKKGENTFPGIDTSKITYIEEEVMYWRKANQVHNWFVENVQNGEDDCGNYYVSREQLEELLNVCKEVLANSKLVEGEIVNGERFEEGKWIPIKEEGKYIEDTSIAKELLPTSSGFFFGSQDYDQWYYEDIKDTVEVLEAELAKKSSANYYYHASW